MTLYGTLLLTKPEQASLKEPVLADFFRASILDQPDLESALSFNLAQLLASQQWLRTDG